MQKSNIYCLAFLVIIGLCGCTPLYYALTPPTTEVIVDSGTVPKEGTRIAVMPVEVEIVGIKGKSETEVRKKGQMGADLFRGFTEGTLLEDGFSVIDRETLDKILKEQGLWLTGAVDEETIGKIGKVVGASHLCFVKVSFCTEFYDPSVGNIGTKIWNIRVVNVTTGEVVHTYIEKEKNSRFEEN